MTSCKMHFSLHLQLISQLGKDLIRAPEKSYHLSSTIACTFLSAQVT